MKILELRNALAKIKTVIDGLTTEIDIKRWLVKLKIKRKIQTEVQEKKRWNIQLGGCKRHMIFQNNVWCPRREERERMVQK